MQQRAFTLLETLLAMTVIASMSVLIAQAYRVAHEAADGGAHLERAVSVQRVLRLMHDQWGDRRSLVLEGSEDSSPGEPDIGLAFLPDRVRFVTATAVLEASWPLVEASYIVERAEADPGVPARWNLVYQERPITSLRLDRTLGERAARLIVLERCTALRIEQFVEEKRDIESTDDIKAAQMDWKPFEVVPEDNDAAPPTAVRISGEYQGEQVTCVFVVRALR